MAQRSQIEWTEMTWNPVTGCTKVSPGCKHCYAEALSHRLQAMGARGYENGFAISVLPERLTQPLQRKAPTIWFVNSMSDLFHPEVPDVFVDRVFDVVTKCPQHIFQILSKRPDRMAAYFRNRKVPANSWLGVTAENRRHGIPRIEMLKGIDAPVRFLSVEPLLENVGRLDLTNIHWVIAGGESGPRARKMSPTWAMSLRDQCEAAVVPFFFKQWGSYGADGIKRSKTANGRLLDGRLHDGMPEAFLRFQNTGGSSR